MGKKDNIIKRFLSKPEIFADLFNGMIFEGKKVISVENLEDVAEASTLILGSADNGSVSNLTSDNVEIIKRERDIIRKAVIYGVEVYLIICGVEHQTHIDASMPFRVMLYDSLEYLRQVRDIRREHKRRKDVTGEEFISLFTEDDKLKPTISIVFYTGEQTWKSNMSLKDMFEPGEPLRAILKHTVNYRMNLLSAYEVADTGRYNSELRLLFEILKHTGSGSDLEEFLSHHTEYSQLDEMTFLTLSTFLDMKYDEIGLKRYQTEGGSVDMCKATMELIERGREQKIIEQIQKKIVKGKSTEVIAYELEESLEYIEKISSMLK